MTTKYDIGEEVTLKDVSFVILEICIGDKGWVRYKIGIRRHAIDSQGYPDDYIIGEFYVDDNLLSKAVKVEEEVPGTIDTDPLYFARGKDTYDN